MKKILTFAMVLSMSTLIAADHHKDNEKKHSKHMKDANERMMKNSNYLMSIKECEGVKDGVGGFLSIADAIWKDIKIDPENEEKWIEAMALADLAANYSIVYDTWCKDMINRVMKKSKMESSKNQETKD